MQKQIPLTYLDIVFADRNKAYGAYELRKNYDKRALLSVAALSIAVLLFAGWSRLAPAAPEELSAPERIGPTVVIDKVYLPPATPAVPEPELPKAATGRTAKTQEFTKAEIVKDNAATKPALKALAPDALAGPVDNPGLKDGNAIAMDKSLNEGGGPADPMSKKGEEQGKTITDEAGEGQPMDIVGQKPAFPGGDAALQRYLKDNLRYPAAARENDIEGTVYLGFVVNTDGSIVDIKVLRSVAGGCTEEAVRVVKGMPKWQAGINNGHKVRVRMTIPIKFRMQH